MDILVPFKLIVYKFELRVIVFTECLQNQDSEASPTLKPVCLLLKRNG